MTMSEFMAWAAYVELYGPVGIAQRIDHAAALVAYTVSAVNGGRTEYRKFLQHPAPSPIEDDGLTDLDRQAIAAFEGARRRTH
jgi:hypothetical protein